MRQMIVRDSQERCHFLKNQWFPPLRCALIIYIRGYVVSSNMSSTQDGVGGQVDAWMPQLQLRRKPLLAELCLLNF